jgi:hypothetical protein
MICNLPPTRRVTFFIPEGWPRIAQRFNAGISIKSAASPEGTAERATIRHGERTCVARKTTGTVAQPGSPLINTVALARCKHALWPENCFNSFLTPWEMAGASQPFVHLVHVVHSPHFRPSLRDLTCFYCGPSVKTLGYCRLSLRDTRPQPISRR